MQPNGCAGSGSRNICPRSAPTTSTVLRRLTVEDLRELVGADAASLQDEPAHFQSKAPGDNSGGSTKSLLGRPGGSPVYARRLLQPSTCGVNGWMTVNAVSSAWNPALPQAPQLTAGRHVAAAPPARLRDRRAEDSR